MVEKVGRPRAPGERYPSGQRRVSADFRSEAQFQRMKEQARLLGMDPIMTSQAGRLFCIGLITSRHMATIDYIAKVYARHAGHVGKEMTRRPKSPSYQPSTSRKENLEENDGGGKLTPAQALASAVEAKGEFEHLQALIPDFPREVRDAIERICVDDEAIPSAWIGDLCRVLTMIEEVRNGERPASRLRGGLPLRKRGPKPPTREEKFEAGAYVHVKDPAVKADRLANLTGEALEAAQRDREGLDRFLTTRNARREAEQEPAT